MKKELIYEICRMMSPHLSVEQNIQLEKTLNQVLTNFSIPDFSADMTISEKENNTSLINQFLSAKKIEGCSGNTLKYYCNTLTNLMSAIQKNICEVTTNDLRLYLSNYQSSHNTSKVTLDNIRRIMSSFFTWLEDEDYILKSPVRRIHKVKTTQIVKETLSDENLEQLRDKCTHPRDLRL